MQLDGFDIRREQRESPFHAHSIGYLANGEGSGMSISLSFDDISLETLDTLFITFLDLIIDSDIITGFELRKFYFSCQLLVYKCYCIVHD